MTYKVLGWVHNFNSGGEMTEESPPRHSLMEAIETLHGLGNVAIANGLNVYTFPGQARVRFLHAVDGTSFGILWIDEVENA